MRSLLVALSLLALSSAAITGNGLDDFDYNDDDVVEQHRPAYVPEMSRERQEKREEGARTVIDTVEERSRPAFSSEEEAAAAADAAAAPPSLFPTPQPLAVFPKVDKKEAALRSLADIFHSGDARPSFVRRRIEEWAELSGQTELISRVLLDLDTKESRTRSTLVLLRTAFRDLEQLLDLAPDARKEKKRIEDIGYAFYPLLSQALHWLRSVPDAHLRLNEIVRAIDELDALLFFSDLSPKELKHRLGVWSQRRFAKADKHLNSAKEEQLKQGGRLDARRNPILLQKILSTVLMDSQRDLNELETVRLGRPIDFAF